MKKMGVVYTVLKKNWEQRKEPIYIESAFNITISKVQLFKIHYTSLPLTGGIE